MQGADVGVGQRRAAEQVVEVRDHARPLRLREEEADRVEPLGQVLDEAVDLAPGRQPPAGDPVVRGRPPPPARRHS